MARKRLGFLRVGGVAFMKSFITRTIVLTVLSVVCIILLYPYLGTRIFVFGIFPGLFIAYLCFFFAAEKKGHFDKEFFSNIGHLTYSSMLTFFIVLFICLLIFVIYAKLTGLTEESELPTGPFVFVLLLMILDFIWLVKTLINIHKNFRAAQLNKQETLP